MATDATIEVGVNFKTDERSLNALVREATKIQEKIKSGTSSAASVRLSALTRDYVASQLKSGNATTATSARIQFEKRAGITSQFAKAATREGADVAQTVLKKEKIASVAAAQLKKEEEKQQAKYDSFATRALGLQFQKEVFSETPTKENKTYLLSGLVGLRRELLKIYMEYRANRREVPAVLRQIAQNTSSMKKDISDWDTGVEKNQTTSGANFLGFVKKMTGIASAMAAVGIAWKKYSESIGFALQRGDAAMRLRAAYGNSVNWGDIRARAGIFNMTEETAAAPSKYAADFRQRMLWGETSEREIIGLSRAGRWGRMVMTGEAARNPEAANRAFEEMVASTDGAKMRSILSQLGLPQDLMQYKIQGYSEEARAEYNTRFAEVAEKEYQAAVMMYDAGNQYQIATQELSGFLAKMTGQGVQYLSPQARQFANNLGVTNITNTDVVSAKRKFSSTMDSAAKWAGFGPQHMLLKAVAEPVIDRIQTGANVSQTNYYTINGTTEETAEIFKMKVDEAWSKALYNAQVNSTPGATTSAG